ncbi:glycosyltransferase [Thiocapsa sp.]|uniref:glycosyltransferase n=1 Tax=Thiocapsa sp. TaxID=2024551 RepID=UPI0026296DA8|nr:glycosyltransferase [Thiocapsa sp.]
MKISVITATWNCVETVGDCLASVAGQSYPDLEHILIDGGSRDGTLDALQPHRARLAVLVSEPGRQAGGAGVEESVEGAAVFSAGMMGRRVGLWAENGG